MADFLPLDGIRVVETSHMIMGPSCGMFLAFLGAEVIKVEPLSGDKTRNLTGMGVSFFPAFNRGKKSVQLDLKAQAGKDALYRLLDSSDALVENFRDESLPAAGLRPEDLRKRFPRLIIVSCKGFLEGPYSHRTALDEVVQMMTGLAYMTGPSGMPLRVGSSANDIMAGLFGATCLLGALRERDSSGVGRSIRIGLFENSVLLVAQHMIQFALLGIEPLPMPEKEFSWPVYDLFETLGGEKIFIAAVTEGQWQTLCEVLGLDELLADPRLTTRVDQIAARKWTLPIIRNAVASRRASDLAATFESAGLPFAPVRRPAEMYDDPQVNRPGGLIESQYQGHGEFSAPGLPFQVDGESRQGRMDVPALGEHTAEVLDELGLNAPGVAAATGKT